MENIKKEISILSFSDWHNGGLFNYQSKFDIFKNDYFESADLLVFAGDITFCEAGDFQSQLKQVELFFNGINQVKSKYNHIIVIPGNHDVIFDKTKADTDYYKKVMELIEYHQWQNEKLIFSNNIEKHSLKINDVEINILTSPFSWFIDKKGKEINTGWGFQILEQKELFEKRHIKELLDNKYDIIISHSPKFKFNDKVVSSFTANTPHVGVNIFNNTKTDLFIAGHIHEGYGQIFDSENKTLHINCSLTNRGYYLSNKPILVKLKKKITYELI